VGSDTLGKLLTELCYRSPGTAKVGETTLKMHVSAEARDLSGEALTRFMNDLHSRLFKMVNRLIMPLLSFPDMWACDPQGFPSFQPAGPRWRRPSSVVWNQTAAAAEDCSREASG
jgi:hypothetical protein